MTVGQLEGLVSPATPVALLLVVGVLILGYFVTRRLVRAINRVAVNSAGAEDRVTASVRRIGERVGELEQLRRLDVVRRYQLEATLRARGVPLPPWPDEDDDQLADLNTAHLETQYFVPPRPDPRRTS